MDIRKTILSLRSIANVLRKVCVVSAAIAAFSSCANDSLQDDLSQSDGEHTVNIAIEVSASSLMTRARVDDEKHKFSPATEAESHIGIANNDYAIFILDGSGNYVQRFEPGAVSLQEQGDDNAVYLLKGGLQYDSKALSSIQLLVVANWANGFGGKYVDFESAIEQMVLSNAEGVDNNIYTAANNAFDFTMPVANSTPKSWTPTGAQGIPMFGLSNSISLANNPDIIEVEKRIPLLRSLAKIEILDMVPNGTGGNIERCVLTSYNARGRFIPNGVANAGWNDDESLQVTTPTLPAEMTVGQNLEFAKYTRSITLDGKDVERDSFIVYVPEMDFGRDARPVINVYIKGVEDPYPIFLSEYEGGKPVEDEQGQYPSLLRNHIYKFNVISVGSAILDFEVETPWVNTEDQEWYYEDIKVSFTDGGANNHPFKWDEQTVKYEEEETMLKPQRTLIISQDEWVEGSFQLFDPKKGTWTLALYGDDNTLNSHFRIDKKLPDGHWEEGADAITGEVGEYVEFRIIPTATNNSTDHYIARVVMTCMTFDGQIIEVNLADVIKNKTADGMTTPTVDNYDYYYVKQYYTGFSSTGDSEPANADISFGN